MMNKEYKDAIVQRVKAMDHIPHLLVENEDAEAIVDAVFAAIEAELEARKPDSQKKREDQDRRIRLAAQPLVDHVKACAKCNGRSTFSVISKCNVAYGIFMDVLIITNEIKDE